MSIASLKPGFAAVTFLEWGLSNSMSLVAPVAPAKLSSESLLFYKIMVRDFCFGAGGGSRSKTIFPRALFGGGCVFFGGGGSTGESASSSLASSSLI